MEKKSTELVITDYKMAGIDGLQLLKKIKERAPETEVIVITAYGTIEVAVEAMKAGAWDFITKPFSMEELRTKINAIIKNKEAQKEVVYKDVEGRIITMLREKKVGETSEHERFENICRQWNITTRQKDIAKLLILFYYGKNTPFMTLPSRAMVAPFLKSLRGNRCVTSLSAGSLFDAMSSSAIR